MELPAFDSSMSASYLQLFLSSWSLDTLAAVYYDAGLLRYNVTHGMIPDSVPFKLNTETFKDIAPGSVIFCFFCLFF